METSEQLNEIAAALVGFQSAMGKIKKEANNPFFKSKYASLPSILEAIREPMTANNLSIVQFPSGENELTTILLHSSGQYMKSSYVMKPVKNDPQGVGSCITYQRRYAVGAILSLSIDEDDDGNAASNNNPIKPNQVQPQAPKQPQAQPLAKVQEKPNTAINQKTDDSVELNWFKKFENEWVTKVIGIMKSVRDSDDKFKNEPLSASVSDFIKNNSADFRKQCALALSSK